MRKQLSTRAYPALTLSLALGLALLSCTGTLTPSQVTPGTDEDGIVLKTQFPVYAPDVPFIQFSIANNSGETAEFGTEWTIERLEDDGWYTLPFKPDISWTQPLFGLLDGGTSSDTAHLSILDHKFRDGTYRIVKEINDTFYQAEFQIGDSPVGKDSPYGFAPLDSLPANYTADMAVADGVVSLDDDDAVSRFVYEMSIGMNTQLRYANLHAEGTIKPADITVEHTLGGKRIAFSHGDGEEPQYFGHLITNGTQVALSAYPTWQEEAQDPTRLRIGGMRGSEPMIAALQSVSASAASPSPEQYLPAAFWSEDGTKLLTLYPDTTSPVSSTVYNPLQFGLSELYEGGGSSGSMCEIDTPGMKAITGARWTNDDAVMLICETDSDLDDMTGYVYYDTEKHEVTGYTYSQYAPFIGEDGDIIIPE